MYRNVSFTEDTGHSNFMLTASTLTASCIAEARRAQLPTLGLSVGSR